MAKDVKLYREQVLATMVEVWSKIMMQVYPNLDMVMDLDEYLKRYTFEKGRTFVA
jgi:hypothetical protein